MIRAPQEFKDLAKELTVQEFRKQEGLEDDGEFDDMLHEMLSEGICPAMCSDPDCDSVEVDGACRHGYPSLFMTLGLC